MDWKGLVLVAFLVALVKNGDEQKPPIPDDKIAILAENPRALRKRAKQKPKNQ